MAGSNRAQPQRVDGLGLRVGQAAEWAAAKVAAATVPVEFGALRLAVPADLETGTPASDSLAEREREWMGGDPQAWVSGDGAFSLVMGRTVGAPVMTNEFWLDFFLFVDRNCFEFDRPGLESGIMCTESRDGWSLIELHLNDGESAYSVYLHTGPARPADAAELVAVVESLEVR
ncbi:MAG: hypothetical protein FWG11_02545 [Promicromonosporaceae bacterium]|nr:hypothetical protein [Promicromonosporaceae bacterium]